MPPSAHTMGKSSWALERVKAIRSRANAFSQKVGSRPELSLVRML